MGMVQCVIDESACKRVQDGSQLHFMTVQYIFQQNCVPQACIAWGV